MAPYSRAVNFALQLSIILNMSQAGRYANSDVATSDLSTALIQIQTPTKSPTKSWNLFGSDPGLKDIKQGKLGNCYFLAALAAVAHQHPEIIKHIFEGPGQLSEDQKAIFRLRLYIGGKSTIIAVDDVVPMMDEDAGDTRSPFWFARWHSGDDLWPLLLEKAFAKVYGSYYQTNGGHPFEPLAALSGAPTYMLTANGKSWPRPQYLWHQLRGAEMAKWPTVACSYADNADPNVVSGHAFTVIGVGFIHPKRPNSKRMVSKKSSQVQAVKMFNPWAANRYQGHIQKQQRDVGTFWMTFDEFMANFQSVTFAEVLPKYEPHNLIVQPGATAITFEIQSDRPFWVNLEWIPFRFLHAEGCIKTYNLVASATQLWVAEAGNVRSVEAAEKFEQPTANSRRLSMKGPGKYIAYVGSDFSDLSSVIKDVTFSVYSHVDDEPKFEVDNSTDALLLGRKMWGFDCDYVAYGFRYTWAPSLSKHLPAWENINGDVLVLNQFGGIVEADDIKGALEKNTRIDLGHDLRDEVRCIDKEKVDKAIEVVRDCLAVELPRLDLVLQVGRETKHDGVQKYAAFVAQKSYRMLFWEDAWELKVVDFAGPSQMPQPVELHDDEEIVCVERKPDTEPKKTDDEDDALIMTDIESTEPTEKSDETETCDVAVAEEAVRRLDKVGLFEELLKGGDDPVFPPEMQSIGPENASCADDAAGDKIPCSTFDSWDSVTWRFGKGSDVEDPSDGEKSSDEEDSDDNEKHKQEPLAALKDWWRNQQLKKSPSRLRK